MLDACIYDGLRSPIGRHAAATHQASTTAAALFIGSRAVGEKAGAKPMARILAGAAAGVEPRIMGIGPAYAIPKALERAGLKLSDGYHRNQRGFREPGAGLP